MIPAFPKILHLGAKDTDHLYDGEIEVTEKLDGSQFSFGKIKGELLFRSKGQQIFADAPPSMFKDAVSFVSTLDVPEGLVVHGEFFQRPRHNTLTYSRKPKNGLAIFGARTLPDRFLSYDDLQKLASDFDCEAVPLVYKGKIDREGILEILDKFLETESILGGVKIEGVVLKNYGQSVYIGGYLVPILCTKYVSEGFKEKHKVGWGKSNPGNMEKIAQALNTEARWKKAIQALQEADTLERSPRDIGALLKYIHQDIEAEEKEELKDMLWNLFRKDILRIACRGFPEWYKRSLVTENIENAEEENGSSD